jgi:hypothetical protein
MYLNLIKKGLPMNYIKYVYCLILMAMSSYCADSSEEFLRKLAIAEVSPRDQEQASSPRQKFLGKYVDLRRAIANSSPRKVESPLRTNSRDGIEKSDCLSIDASPRDIESPRTRLKKSMSLNFTQERDNKTLRDVKALDEGSSPRGEEIVLSLLRKTKERKKRDEKDQEIFRRKSIDFKLSSPNPRLLIEEHKESPSNKNYEGACRPKSLSEEDQRLLQQGLIEICFKNKDQEWRGTFNRALEDLVDGHEQRILAKEKKESQKEEEPS